MTRRSFIAALASAAAATGAGGCRMLGWRTGRIRLGLVGVTGDEFASAFPALDASRVECAAVPDDPREIKSLAKSLDLEAVYIACPLKSRCKAAVAAMKAGLHVYAEPLQAGTLWELEQFNNAARKHGAVTQLGDFESAGSGFRRAVEVISSGVLGAAEKACAWCPGATADGAAEAMNLPFRALELGRVRTVKAESGGVVELSFAPVRSRLRKNTTLPPVAFTLCPDGTNPPDDVLKAYADSGLRRPARGWFVRFAGGAAFAGTDGALFASDGARAVSVDEIQDAEGVPAAVPRLAAPFGARQAHLDEFLDAVRRRGPKYPETLSRAYSDLAHSVPLAESVLVASVAQATLRPGESLRWDSAIMHFDRADANLLTRPADWKSFPQ